MNKKSNYLNPKMDVIDLSFDDIICASSCSEDTCPTHGGCVQAPY